MLNEIINKYESFSDALILEITYRSIDNLRCAEIIISCMNTLNDYEYEKIKLIFTDIIYIHFNENENQSSTLVNSALMINNNGIIVVDFFPLIYGKANLKENNNSDFKIKCRDISYARVACDF